MTARTLTVIQHHPDEGPGRLAHWAATRGWALDIVHAEHGPFPASPEALVLLGGPHSLLSPPDWLRAEHDALAALLTASPQLPVLGICLGAQLLASALGATLSAVGFVELGWTRVSVHDGTTWQPLDVLQWHEDGFSLPEGAQCIARGARWPMQGFRHGPRLALQFHPEWDAPMLHAMRAAFDGLPFDNTDVMQRQQQVGDWFDATLDGWIAALPQR